MTSCAVSNLGSDTFPQTQILQKYCIQVFMLRDNSNTNIGSNISSLIRNGAKVEDSKKMANIFNSVFVNTAHK